MKLSELLDVRSIKISLEATNKEEVFEELVDLLVRAGRVKDREGALRGISNREKLGSTGIGEGIAIPHGTSKAVDGLVAALGISQNGIEFDSLDGEPVYVVFLLLARGDNPGPHVRALANIARLVRIPGFCRRLREAKSPQEVMELLRQEEADLL